MSSDPQRIPLPTSAEGGVPELSIVVMFTHDADQAEECLRGIATISETVPDSETIVVLNASSEAVRELVLNRTAGARIIDSPVNTGTSVAWNLAFAAARADRVLLMHEDAIPNAKMARRLLTTIESEPTAGVVGPWLAERETDAPTNAGWLVWRDMRGSLIAPDDVPDDLRDAPYAVNAVSSAMSLWDKQAWKEAGGFEEERFPAIGVDGATCAALAAAGRPVLSDPGALAIHRAGAMDSAPSPLSGPRLRDYLFSEYKVFFLKKWSELLAQFVDLDENGWQYPLPREAVEAGIRSAERRRTERWRYDGDAPRCGHPLTNPDMREPWPTDLDEAMIARLEQAQRDTIDGYCFWLIEREKQLFASQTELLKTEKELHEHIQEIWTGHLETVDLLNERSAKLDAIESGGWWKLRGRLRRLIGKRG